MIRLHWDARFLSVSGVFLSALRMALKEWNGFSSGWTSPVDKSSPAGISAPILFVETGFTMLFGASCGSILLSLNDMASWAFKVFP